MAANDSHILTVGNLGAVADVFDARYAAASDLDAYATTAYVDAAGGGGGASAGYVDLHDAFELVTRHAAAGCFTVDKADMALSGNGAAYQYALSPEEESAILALYDLEAIEGRVSGGEGVVEVDGFQLAPFEPGTSLQGVDMYAASEAAMGYLMLCLLASGTGEPVGMVQVVPGRSAVAFLSSLEFDSVSFFPEGSRSAEAHDVVTYEPKQGVAVATSGSDGLMSAADKARLDGIAEMSASDLADGTSTAGMLVSPKAVSDYVSGEIDDALGVILNGSY